MGKRRLKERKRTLKIRAGVGGQGGRGGGVVGSFVVMSCGGGQM